MAATNQFLLYESAAGYALFQKNEAELIASGKTVEDAVATYENFSQMVKLVAFQAFGTAEEGLTELCAIAAGKLFICIVEYFNYVQSQRVRLHC